MYGKETRVRGKGRVGFGGGPVSRPSEVPAAGSPQLAGQAEVESLRLPLLTALGCVRCLRFRWDSTLSPAWQERV